MRNRAFTLLELLVVIAVVAALAALLLPSLARSKALARKVECSSNLRQLSLATHMYWDDNNGACFRWELGATNGGRLYWFGWLQDGPEGDRAYDAVPGALYTRTQGVSDDGIIVGYYTRHSGTFGFILKNGNHISLAVPGANATFADGINAGGQVVGGYSDSFAVWSTAS